MENGVQLALHHRAAVAGNNPDSKLFSSARNYQTGQTTCLTLPVSTSYTQPLIVTLSGIALLLFR
jgi:hypothetical protein